MCSKNLHGSKIINNKCGVVTSPDSPAVLHVTEGLDGELVPEHLLAQPPGECVGVVTLHRGVQDQPELELRKVLSLE